MRATGTESNFNKADFDEDEEKMIDSKMIGHSANFKSVTRRKLDRIKGTRPPYEKDFSNSVGRYNVKHFDKKITGKVAFDSPKFKPRVLHPNKL